jgi:DNA processing protein
MTRESRLRAALGLKPARNQEHAGCDPEVLDQLIRGGYDALLPDSEGYPEGLRPQHGAPPVLFTWGGRGLLARPAVGMCGSRDASPRGLEAAAACGEEVASAGFAVVSGYARGVDTETHLAALRAGGVTVIVLAEGVLHFKPKRVFKGLPFDEEHVLAVSQFSPTQAWTSWAAMTRNKVIVAASQALVVIEARDRGGTLDAGIQALRVGRPLLVLDFGTDAPAGNRRLLDQGGIAVRTRSELRTRLTEQVKSPTFHGEQLALLKSDAGQTTALVPEHYKRCQTCGLTARYPEGQIRECIDCGGALEDEPDAPTDDTGVIRYAVPFALIECESCGQATLVRRSRNCTRCGASLAPDAVDPTTESRRSAFKGAISRLQDRVRAAHLDEPRFTKSGVGMSPADYGHTILDRARIDIPAILAPIKDDAPHTSWDADERECVEALTRIITSIDTATTAVAVLMGVLPPLDYRGAHHILVRTLGSMVAGHAAMLRSLIAADVDEAREREKDGQHVLNRANRTAGLLVEVLHRSKSMVASDGWRLGHAIDMAAVAWEGVRNQPATIWDAAGLVRTALSGIPGVADLTDADAIVLLPATVLPVPIVDSVLVEARALLARGVLDQADASAPDWLDDKAELIERVSSALRTLNDQVDVLLSLPEGTEGRRLQAEVLTGVYKTLMEGPLRDLGGVLVIAARATRGRDHASYAHNVALGVQAGEVVQELLRLGSPWHEPAEMLIRNANAHAGIVVLDHGIQLTERTTRDHVQVSESTITLTDAEFAERFAGLFETVLALQLAILPWIFTHPDPALAAARRAVVPTQAELGMTIRLLAGIFGLVGVHIERSAHAMTVSAQPANVEVDLRALSIPSLLPGIFHVEADVERVTLSLAEREPVTFAREEIVTDEALPEDERLASVGLVARRWIGSIAGPEAIRADLTWVCRPHIDALSSSMLRVTKHLSGSRSDIEEIIAAERSLDRVTARLCRADLAAVRSPLVSGVRNLLQDGSHHLHALRNAFSRRNNKGVARERQECAAVMSRVARTIEEIDKRLAEAP